MMINVSTVGYAISVPGIYTVRPLQKRSYIVVWNM